MPVLEAVHCCRTEVAGLDLFLGLDHPLVVVGEEPGVGHQVDVSADPVIPDAAVAGHHLDAVDVLPVGVQSIDVFLGASFDRLLGSQVSPVESVSRRVPPVEGAKLLHVFQHPPGIHVVLTLEDLFPKKGKQRLHLPPARLGLWPGDRQQSRVVAESGGHLLHIQAGNRQVIGAGHHAQAANLSQQATVQFVIRLGDGLNLLDPFHHPRFRLHERLEAVGRFGHGAKPLDGLLGAGPNFRRPQQFAPLPGHFLLVMPVHVIGHAADLVEEDPAQLPVDPHPIGVVLHPFFPQEVDALADPRPPFLGRVGRHRNVVRHVPGVKGPDLRKLRLQRGDPLAQLIGLVVLARLLEVMGAVPEKVRRQAAERPQGRIGDRQVPRHVLQCARRQAKLEVLPLIGHSAGHRPTHRDRAHRHGDRQKLNDAVAIHGHSFPGDFRQSPLPAPWPERPATRSKHRRRSRPRSARRCRLRSDSSPPVVPGPCRSRHQTDRKTGSAG